MKKVIVIVFAALAFASCRQSATSKLDGKVDQKANGESSANAPKFEFDETIYDFGVIKQGESVKYDFKFKNVGRSPLIISDATATCGCTVPEYPTTPIKPGESGVIKVVFNSTGKEGMQDKVVTITSNANPEAEKLHLAGEVKVK